MRTIRAAGGLVALALAFSACESPLETPTPGTGLELVVAFDGEFGQTVDGGMVRVRGAASRNVSINPGETKEILLSAGTYSVALEALESGRVLRFGERPNVTVTEGQITTVTVNLSNFVPSFSDVPAEVVPGEPFTLDWSSVTGAETYKVEVSTSADFGSIVRTETVTTNTVSMSLSEPGSFYFRVVAVNRFASDGVPSEPSSPVRALEPCEVFRDLSLGQTVQGELTTSDCTIEVLGSVRFLDFYTLNFEQPQAAGFRQQSNNPFMAAFTTEGRTAGFASVEGADQEVPLNIFLPRGNTTLAVSGSTGGSVGSYTLTARQRNDWLEHCEVWWLSLPEGVQWTSIPADISDTDCGDDGFFFDWVTMWLEAGQRVQITMTSTAVDSYLVLFGPAGEVVAEDDDGAGGLDSFIDFTATQSGDHALLPATFARGETGAYSLAVTDVAAQESADARPAPAVGGGLSASWGGQGPPAAVRGLPPLPDPATWTRPDLRIPLTRPGKGERRD